MNILTDEEILKCVPIAKQSGKPCVWLTQKDAIQAIKNCQEAVLKKARRHGLLNTKVPRRTFKKAKTK